MLQPTTPPPMITTLAVRGRVMVPASVGGPRGRVKPGRRLRLSLPGDFCETCAMPALPVTQQITFLDTEDLARTAEFYEDILGLRLARDQGTCRIYHVCEGAYLGFCRRDPASAVAPRSAAGVTVKPPADNPPYRIYNAFVRDPNGYLVEIQRFWEPLA